MRTKTLLIAAAALAATVISSQAQTVYSQNIVGYANVTFPGAGPQIYTLGVAPLNNGTNAADQILTCLQPGDTLYIWEGSSYYSSEYLGSGSGPQGQAWQDQYGNWTNAPTLVPGQGFYFQNNQGVDETNTYAGSVVLTNSIDLSGTTYIYSLVGSTPPVAGYLDSTNFNLPLQPGDTCYVWAGTGYYSDEYLGSGSGPQGQAWQDQYGNWTNAPYVNVGQGFYYQNNQGSDEIWNQSLSVQ